MRKIGAHVSAAGGLELAIERAKQMGANCVQLFSGSPRVWQKRSLTEIDFNKVCSLANKLSISPIFTHALYLVNLASDQPLISSKSIASVKYELEFDAAIKGAGVIVHIGSHQGRGWEAVKDLMVARLKEILTDTPPTSKLLIENSAGQKGKLHGDLQEIRWTLDQLSTFVDQKRLGWCVDTCHAFAAGYGLAETPPSLLPNDKPLLADAITKLKLWSTLSCIHVNDSKDAFASGRDRHENIGDGQIPLAHLQTFLNLDQVKDIPLITEVPGIDGHGPDRTNLERIKNLVA